MPELPRFGGDDALDVSEARARIAVLPVPYEGTVSYGGGASRGPAAILAASAQLEMHDEELDACPDRLGIHTLPPVACAGADPEAVMERIRAAAEPPLRRGRWLLTLGGEHSVTCGVLAACRAVRGGRPFSVLQIDAHADLRESYEGQRYSHASVMARVRELGVPFVQVGIRSLSQGERGVLRRTGLEANVFWAHGIAGRPAAEWVPAVLERLGALGHEDVYITIDLDGLDPALVPATGTPEPGGLGWWPTLALLRAVAERFRLIGADVCELAPLPGLHAPDFLAARLAYKLMGYAFERELGEF